MRATLYPQRYHQWHRGRPKTLGTLAEILSSWTTFFSPVEAVRVRVLSICGGSKVTKRRTYKPREDHVVPGAPSSFESRLVVLGGALALDSAALLVVLKLI